jgi:hypothetical protein
MVVVAVADKVGYYDGYAHGPWIGRQHAGTLHGGGGQEAGWVQPWQRQMARQGITPGAGGSRHASGQPSLGIGAQVKTRKARKLAKFAGLNFTNAVGVLPRMQNRSAGNSNPHLALVWL